MTLHWKFRNDHEWHKTFSNEDELYTFMYRVGLTLHPDIVSVWIMNDGQKTTIF